MKLELKHIAPYLPYGLKCITRLHKGNGCNWGSLLVYGLSSENALFYPEHDEECWEVFEDIKPILHHLSEYCEGTILEIKNKLDCDLFNVIEIRKLCQCRIKLDEVTYSTYIVMCRNLIDFNNLINDGLAIDINTLEK